MMRMWAIFLFAFILAPAVASSQPPVIKPDSAGVARAIAKAIRTPILKNGAPRAAAVVSKTITPESADWNRRVVNELRALDTALIARRPSKETMLINVVTLTMSRDSASANVAMRRCYGDRFVGSSALYELKRNGAEWTIVAEQRGMAARGACPK